MKLSDLRLLHKLLTDVIEEREIILSNVMYVHETKKLVAEVIISREERT